MYTSALTIMFLMPFLAMVNFLVNQTHFLMALLSLEGVMLSLVLFIPSTMTFMDIQSTAMSVILLTFGACEASLGLSLLVMMSRSYGTDMFNSLSTNKC